MPISQPTDELIKDCLEKDFARCEELNILCDVKAKHQHCIHCPKIFSTPSSCKRHFKLGHLKRAVSYKGNLCLPCKNHHHGYTSVQTQGHYHCPICKSTVLKQSRFIKHLQNHENNLLFLKNAKIYKKHDTVLSPSPITGHNSFQQQINMAVGSENLINTSISENDNSSKVTLTKLDVSLISKPSTTRNCPICNKIVHKKSLARHCRVAHSKEIQSTVCVDKEQGLFFVLRNDNKSTSSNLRIHVKKILDPTCKFYGVDCENNACSEYMSKCWKGGFKAAECNHLQEATQAPHYPEPVVLSLDVLNRTFSIGDYDMFDKQRIFQCQELHKQACDQNIETVVAVEDGQGFIHFSVYAYQTPTKFGRIGVVADFRQSVLDCDCCEIKKDCIHKDICLWYLRQNDLLHGFVSKEPVQSEEIVIKQEIPEEQFTVIVNEEMPCLINDILS